MLCVVYGGALGGYSPASGKHGHGLYQNVYTDIYIYIYLGIKTGEMISGFVPSQLKEARLLANFRFISTTPTELGAAVLTFVRHDMD